MRKLVLLLVVPFSLSCAGEGTTTQFSELPDEDPAVVADSPITSPRVSVDALVIDNNVYPVSKFRNVTGLECDQEAHWHSDEAVPAVGQLSQNVINTVTFFCDVLLDGAPVGPTTCREDPQSNGCGHGKVSEVTRQQVQLFQECLDAYEKASCN